jgi:hypothetical protein
MTEQTRKFLLGIYLAEAIATLVFQVAVRTRECTGASNCALTYGKAAVWLVIWPAAWGAYLKGWFYPDAALTDMPPREGLPPEGRANA